MKSRGSASGLPTLPARILGFSRVVRIAFVMAFSIAVTLLFVPIFFPLEFSSNSPSGTLPLLAAVGVGVIMYAIGWRLMIGYIGELPPERPAVLLYFLAGLVVLLITILLLVFGAVIGSEL